MSLTADQKYRSWVEVNLDNFTANWEAMRTLVGPAVKILQVVKADAYGHGAIEISNVALRNGACALGVANADEGVQLRVGGIIARVLILSPSTDREIGEIIKYDLTPSVSDLGFARQLQQSCRKANVRVPIHIEVDTGMGRGGILHTEALAMIEEIFHLPNIAVEGVFTHLSISEIPDDYNLMQRRLFEELLEKLEAKGIPVPLKHMANSGAVLNYPAFHMDMVRPGLMSYGIYPSPETRSKASLVPVMSFKTRVVLLKKFPSGYSIGYNRTYRTEGPAHIATIPVGYGDGYGLMLSNQGEALIRGKRVPIVGRVSMDMCTLDVSDVEDCRVGDEVVLMGKQGRECIAADDIAKRVNTISYDVLCALGKRAPRIYIQKGKKDAVEPQLRRIFIPDEERSISRIDNIIRRCFQTRARNEELGDAIYYEMFETLFGKEDRQLELRTDFRYDIRVSKLTDRDALPDRLTGDYFRLATHIGYTKAIRDHVFLIGCALDNEQLAAFFEDKRCEYRWLLNRGDDLVMERDFRIDRVRIDNEDVPIISSGFTERGYEVWCGDERLKKKRNRRVKVEIEIETLKSKLNNLYSVYVVYPTRGLDITFDYEGTDFKNVREVSYFSGKHPYPRISREKGKWIKLKIDENDWIFPNSGVTFIWDL
ncbi:MAG: alanine racemase [Deltaproteobacteria bacterium]|nr:alanine racemase [Deltaproteobacteria bacterium]